MLKTALNWAFDSIYFFSGLWRIFRYYTPPAKYLNSSKPGRPTIVIITGYGSRWGYLHSLLDYISAAGYPVYTMPELGHHLKSIKEEAEIISQVLKARRLNNVILLGYSKGGLVGKYFLAYENVNPKVRGLVSLAAPFTGVNHARFFPFLSVNELAPDSPVLRKLNREIQVNRQIVSIRPKVDVSVLPGGSILEGAKNVIVNVNGHKKLTTSKIVFEEVLKAISGLS